jgi:hypothetical protein
MQFLRKLSDHLWFGMLFTAFSLIAGMLLLLFLGGIVLAIGRLCNG